MATPYYSLLYIEYSKDIYKESPPSIYIEYSKKSIWISERHEQR